MPGTGDEYIPFDDIWILYLRGGTELAVVLISLDRVIVDRAFTFVCIAFLTSLESLWAVHFEATLWLQATSSFR